jgi:uncharacterized protein YpuA (DUF1002 family)
MDKIEQLKFHTFNSGSIDVVEALWRQTDGNRDKAYKIVRDHAKHYGIVDLDDIDIDICVAEINDGMEVEWKS